MLTLFLKCRYHYFQYDKYNLLYLLFHEGKDQKESLYCLYRCDLGHVVFSKNYKLKRAFEKHNDVLPNAHFKSSQGEGRVLPQRTEKELFSLDIGDLVTQCYSLL